MRPFLSLEPRLSLIGLLCAFGFAGSFAEPKPAVAAESKKSGSTLQKLQDVQKIAAKRTDFSVLFTQESYSSIRKKVTKLGGKLEFSPQKNFRWEILEPGKREVYVSNGKDFWKYTEATRHAQRLSPDAPGLEALDIILKLGTLTEKFTIEDWKQESATTDSTEVMSDAPPVRANGKLYVKLVPKEKSLQEKLLLSIDEKQGIIEELRIVYRGGNRWRVGFSGFSTEKVDKTRFDFTPPPGTAVDKD